MVSYTVSDVNRFIKQIFSAEDILHNINIKGEISNFIHHLRSGHYYFTLKDTNSSLKCVMFKGNNSKLRFMPENGMQVIARGDIQSYERDGIYQLYCVDIQPDGAGALAVAFEQLKEKLSNEGLFRQERKKQLPKMPETVGVITSITGAALQDIINVLNRRYPLCKLLVFPALVQGEDAPKSICSAIQTAEHSVAQVLIVGRGGGSVEDLWAFNDEKVARAIANCNIPIVSAIGHEVDYTIADFVADLRAPTPSAAAEIVSPDINELASVVYSYKNILIDIINDNIEENSQAVDMYLDRLLACSPKNQLAQNINKAEQLKSRLDSAFENIFSKKTQRFASSISLLETLSPLNVLKRGYTITAGEDSKPIKSCKKLKAGDVLISHFKDGTIQSIVKK